MSEICYEWGEIDSSKYHGIWVFLEVEGDSVNETSLQMLSVAKNLAEKKDTHVAGVLVGYNVKELAKESIYYGADKVYLIDNSKLGTYYAKVYAQVIAKVVTKYKPEAILIGGTMIGREFAPFLANTLRSGITADCTSFEVDPKTSDIVQVRPTFGSFLLASIKTVKRKPVISTARPNVFNTPKKNEDRKGDIIEESVNDLPDPKIKLIRKIKIENKEEVPIEKSPILVSGGKGLGSKEGFKTLEELAEILGGTVSGSRKAVDLGWIPHEKQVGQTGKTVLPSIYIAVGISGAAQHIFGIREVKRVVGINLDPDAPIFDNVDYGIVGDYKQVIPKLIESLKKNSGSSIINL